MINEIGSCQWMLYSWFLSMKRRIPFYIRASGHFYADQWAPVENEPGMLISEKESSCGQSLFDMLGRDVPQWAVSKKYNRHFSPKIGSIPPFNRLSLVYRNPVAPSRKKKSPKRNHAAGGPYPPRKFRWKDRKHGVLAFFADQQHGRGKGSIQLHLDFGEKNTKTSGLTWMEHYKEVKEGANGTTRLATVSEVRDIVGRFDFRVKPKEFEHAWVPVLRDQSFKIFAYVFESLRVCGRRGEVVLVRDHDPNRASNPETYARLVVGHRLYGRWVCLDLVDVRSPLV